MVNIGSLDSRRLRQGIRRSFDLSLAGVQTKRACYIIEIKDSARGAVSVARVKHECTEHRRTLLIVHGYDAAAQLSGRD